MKKAYYIDFSGCCGIEADSEAEAKARFWEYINEDKPLPRNVYLIEKIEKGPYFLM